MNFKISLVLFLLMVVFMQSCMVDLRPPLIKKEGIAKSNVEKGKKILQEAWLKQGFHQLHEHSTYSFNGNDTWKGLMGKIGKPWPDAKSNMFFQFEVGTFDSQVKYLDGKKANVSSGLQSWNYYEFEEGAKPQKMKMNKRVRFGLSAYQYFFEMLDRMKNAPIISWAGEEKFLGKKYDIVFVTWNKVEPHMGNDQYKLLINQETKLLDYAIYTLRENYLKMPGGRSFHGSVKYDDYRAVNGILIPHKQTVFLNKPKKNDHKNVHQLLVTDFRFDSFDVSLLKPFSEVTPTGNSKEKG